MKKNDYFVMFYCYLFNLVLYCEQNSYRKDFNP